MQIILRILLILAMAAIPCPSPVLAVQNTYNGSGTGPTERAAIQDAFRKILENAQGIEVESNSYLTNSTIDSDRIHSYTNGHIENYTLLDSHFDGLAYTVKIEANVAPGAGLAVPCFLSSKNPHFHQDNSPSSSWGNPHFQRGHQDADFIAASCRMSACSIR